jgi:hypothetical protein
MQPKTYILLSAWLALTAGAPMANAQITNVGRPSTTSTQAVLSYQAPDDNPCTIEVREKGSTELAHDVNPALFAGSNSDLSRPTTAVIGQRRVVVAGARIAPKASDGYRYSRALQADTEHEYSIACGASSYNGTFRTTNIPVGLGYLEAIPSDAENPGRSAWPELKWGDRNQKIIDPQTGVLIRRVTTETEVFLEDIRNFVSASSGPNWTSASSVLADDAAVATYSGSTQDTLFVEFGNFDFFGGTHSNYASAYNDMEVTFNAWCQGGDCTTANPDDRTLEVCMTIDGVSCASQPLSQVLAVCSASCNGATPHRYRLGDAFTGASGPLSAWFPTTRPPFDHTSINKRFGGVNRDGVQVTLAWGNVFDANWTAGSKIRINGTIYTIDTVINNKSLLLANAPLGVENGVAYETSNFGFLFRKKTASTTPLVLQYARFRYIAHNGPGYWDAAGSSEAYTNCSSEAVPGPNGELGWHCHISGKLHWIGKDTGNSTYIGSTKFPPGEGVDGWTSFYCGQAYWDRNQGNDLLCVTTGNGGDTIIVRARYNGDNRAIVGPQGIFEELKDCAVHPQPCWNFANLTPASQNRSLQQLVTAFHPDFASFVNTGFKFYGLVGPSSRLLFGAARDNASNDQLTFFAYFNTLTGQIDAAGPSWKYWPLRWATVHGPGDIGDQSWTIWPVTYFRGPFTGRDSYAGNGPYISRVSSGPITTAGEPCPARPAGSPIAAADWPTGNVCITLTVDGEPGDPTPNFTDNGTVTVTGNIVTITGGNFPTNIPPGSKMKIGGAYYVFTRTSATTGTLSPQPVVSIVNSAYQLFLETVDNPKTGTARRDNAYLQDAEVRDIFCAETEPDYGGTNGCSFFFRSEYFRLLIKDGNTWVLERGYGKKGIREEFFPVDANAMLITVPPSCDFAVYPCARSSVYWNIDQDPLGMNADNGMISGSVGNGAGHGILRPIAEVAAVALGDCPVVDGLGYSCYNARIGNSMKETLESSTNIVFNGQPPFHGLMGHGVPNDVDSHPSLAGFNHPMFQQPGIVPRWFLDARPFLGGSSVSGNSGSPATQVTGDLYKFTSAQVPRLRRKVMPTMAFCGANPLHDISGPVASIGGTSSDAYRYCVAGKNGECRGDSLAGDVYFNCPFLTERFCRTGSIGQQESDTRDVCIGDHAALTMSIMQGGPEKTNMHALHLRPLTKGLSQYHYVDVFWNVKSTPDGNWLIFRTTWADNYSHQIMLAKLPPFPAHDGINRGDFIPVGVDIPPPADPSETHAVVEFGYNKDFHCTSRADACIKGAETSVFAYESETTPGVACASGCRIVVPGLPQHVLYYRVVRRKGSTVRGSEGQFQVTALP